MVLALEHVDAALGERGDELVAAVDVPVVVAEHREHRHVLERGRGARDHRGLLRLAVRGEVAGQQHEVDAAVQRGEATRRAPRRLRGRVDVPGRRDPDRTLVLRWPGGPSHRIVHAAPVPGYPASDVVR